MINKSLKKKSELAKIGSVFIQGGSFEQSNGKGGSSILKPLQNNFMGNTGDAKMYTSGDQIIKNQSNGDNQVSI